MSRRNIWTVVFTRFADDYKPRGDWSYVEETACFSTEALAKKFVHQSLIDKIFGDYSPRENPSYYQKELPTFFTADGQWDKTKLQSLENVEVLAASVFQGEYVQRKLGWEITQSKVHTKVDPLDLTIVDSLDDSADDSGSDHPEKNV